MASTLGLLGEAPFQLIAPTTERVQHKLVNLVNVGNAAHPEWEKRTAYINKINVMEKELIADTIREFKDAMVAARLNLTAAKRFAMFRELLEEPFRSEYDAIRGDHNVTNPGFLACLQAFINRYFLATDLEDETLYLDTVKKPFKLSVDELASRLRNINIMMSLLTADGANPFTENQLKHKLFRMMPRPWQICYVHWSAYDNSCPSRSPVEKS